MLRLPSQALRKADYGNYYCWYHIICCLNRLEGLKLRRGAKVEPDAVITLGFGTNRIVLWVMPVVRIKQELIQLIPGHGPQ